MKKEIKKEDVKFQIKGIELLDVNVEYPKVQLKGVVVFKFNINVEIKFVNENSFVIAIVSVDILDNETADKFGFIKASCIFGVENFNSFLNSETNKVEFPKQFLTIVNSISISTIRGLMFSQFRGTFLHGALLPIIDPTFLEKGNK
jgi:hypothetical protein